MAKSARLRALEVGDTPYVVPRDDIVNRVMIPAMARSSSVDCMAAFFNSRAFGQLAPGLAHFIDDSSGLMRLAISPVLSQADVEAVEAAERDPGLAAQEAALRLFEDGRISPSRLVQHAVACLCWLLATARLEMRVVLMRGRGIFHPKVWVFKDSRSMLAMAGSSNATEPGLLYNYETVQAFGTWMEGRAATANFYASEFESIWNDREPTSRTLHFPQAFTVLRQYAGEEPPTVDDYVRARESDIEAGFLYVANRSAPASEAPIARLRVPDYVEYQSGPYEFQGQAVTNWEANERRGVLAMATGSGKTITSLIAAQRLQETIDSGLLVLVAAPFRPLILQWEKEIREFGIEPISRGGSQQEGLNAIRAAYRALEAGVSRAEAVVVTHEFLKNPNLHSTLASFGPNAHLMLVADEVHRLGTRRFLASPPEAFQYRLGLSATPIRQYDPWGTEGLFDYIGPTVYEFSLKDAISAGVLVPYAYHLHEVHMSEDELDQWDELTSRLILAGWVESHGEPFDYSGDDIPDDIMKLLVRRRAILETVESKVSKLADLLTAEQRSSLSHTLIYTSAKNETQMQDVNRLLNQLGFRWHRLTHEETGSGRADELLAKFGDGELQILTAKRVLDEGVNVPQTQTAYLMASSTVHREWIQRRGRILRTHGGKAEADLHDFFVVPPNPASGSSKAIIRGELTRAREFAVLAANAGDPDGPHAVMAKWEPVLEPGVST